MSLLWLVSSAGDKDTHCVGLMSYRAYVNHKMQEKVYTKVNMSFSWYEVRQRKKKYNGIKQVF